jgi:hypothetical protein
MPHSAWRTLARAIVMRRLAMTDMRRSFIASGRGFLPIPAPPDARLNPHPRTKEDVMDRKAVDRRRVLKASAAGVCDYAGFAPFGFGYRRCPGEQLTIQVFEDFLRKAWRDKIVFRKLNLANIGRVPVGPNAVIEDGLGFTRSA